MLKLSQLVLYFISGHGRGWVFSSSDLIKKFERQQVDNILSDLVVAGKIQRIYRGMYYYPKYSELLNTYLSPNIDLVAQAFARKFNWNIEISGETALNIMGLSTQVQGKYIYLSNGPSRAYDIVNTSLIFKKSSLKNIGFKHRESSLVVQVLRTLGKDRLDNSLIDKIKSNIEPKMYLKILDDTKNTTDWIYEFIKKIFKEA